MKCLVFAAAILFGASSCGGRTPQISREQAVLIAVHEASKREPVLPDAYEAKVEGGKGEWVVKFRPKPQGRRNSIWVYVDQQNGAVKKAEFWQ